MIDCESYWTILQRCNARHRQMFFALVNVYVFDIGSIYSDNLYSIKNTGKDLTLNQMFEISEKLIVEQINWENFNGNNYLWSMMKKSHAKVHVFSDSVLCLVKVHQNPLSNSAWEEKLSWFKSSSQYRTLDTIDGKLMEFESNIFPGSTTLQLVKEVQKVMNKMSDPDQFQGRVVFMSMFNDIVWGIKDNEQECLANVTLVSVFAKKISSGTLVIPRT